MANPPGHYARMDVAPNGEALLDEDSSASTVAAEPRLAANSATQIEVKDVAPCPIHHLIEEQAKRTPKNIALESSAVSLTYAQLDQAANRFAWRLRNAGVKRGELVGLFVDRGPHAIVAILGILKAGAAYLPLDPTYPEARIHFMLTDAQPRGVVTTEPLADVFYRHLQAESCEDCSTIDVNSPQVWKVDLDEILVDEPASAVQGDSPPEVGTQPSDLAYAIYTSGSTGRPKAALLAHQGLRNLCAAQHAFFPVTAESRVLQFASLCFDASVSEIFVTLTCGATLCLVGERDLAPSRLAETLNKLRISVATIPPSVLNSLYNAELPWLQTLVTAGESCPTRLVERFSVGRRLINAYGPTEATVCATMHVCDPGDAGPPPIGPAIPGCQALILDQQQNGSSPGETGEIYLSGIGLAQGYLNRPQLTAEKFVSLPHRGDGLWYRTGDLARLRADGSLEFVGRTDQQVKIRGVRIELGELEHALEQHADVQEAVITTHENDSAKRLAAHVSIGSGSSLTSEELLTWLRSRVMPAMLPSELHCRETMPLLPNGKIDRKALQRLIEDNHSAKRQSCEPQESDPVAQQGPRDRLELLVSELFREILSIASVRLNDDFFVLGGDSLQAMDLLARLETELGFAPSMPELMQSPTTSGLAKALAGRIAESSPGDGRSAAWNPLVPLSPSGATHPPGARPLYCLHPGGGNALCFLDLAKHLAADRPVIGITARGLEPGQTPLETVDALATEYLAAIREHQPEGPYAICGWSFGGIVAFEVANRLIQAGEEIEHLGIIDIGLLYSFGVLTTLFPEGDLALFELRRLPPDDQIREFTTRTAAAKLIPPGANVELARRIYDTFMANVDAMMNYRPEHYPGRMTLYRAAEPLVQLRRELADEWTEFCDHIEVCSVAGNHLTIIHEPNVADLADQMRQRLAFR
ncbi:MAG: amino acid adenylation domain-containing protein [Pirellulales bacterium]|nr:amino acid adenylation domain-containing protein [Pirellulales bacterium]